MSLAFFISLFNAQHASDVSTSILRSLRLICWVISWVVLLWFEHTSNQSNTTHAITHQISRKILRIDELTSETCWALNNEIIKQVTSSWFLFIQHLCVFIAFVLTTTTYWRARSWFFKNLLKRFLFIKFWICLGRSYNFNDFFLPSIHIRQFGKFSCI